MRRSSMIRSSPSDAGMSGRSAVDAFTTGSPALIEARHAQGIVRQHLAHDRGEPWQCGGDIIRDGELAEQFQRASKYAP